MSTSTIIKYVTKDHFRLLNTSVFVQITYFVASGLKGKIILENLTNTNNMKLVEI